MADRVSAAKAKQSGMMAAKRAGIMGKNRASKGKALGAGDASKRVAKNYDMPPRGAANANVRNAAGKMGSKRAGIMGKNRASKGAALGFGPREVERRVGASKAKRATRMTGAMNKNRASKGAMGR
jgi:hypothetical protein